MVLSFLLLCATFLAIAILTMNTPAVFVHTTSVVMTFFCLAVAAVLDLNRNTGRKS